MTTISSVIFKVAATCNLNCSYCYMFNGKDQSTLSQPATMPLEVVRAAAKRICEYAISKDLPEMNVILHGGEPLLVGRTWLEECLDAFLIESAGRVKFSFSIQTNGVLLNQQWIELLRKYKIAIGVSLDGPAEVNDQARVNHAGKGSYEQARRGLELLLANSVPTGILCVVNPDCTGAATYEHLRQIGVNYIDFLIPYQYNWDNPLQKLVQLGLKTPSKLTPIGDYLISAFDSWWDENDEDVYVRLFDNILSGILGGKSSMDAIGGNPITFAIIETDGSIQPLDNLRAAKDGILRSELNVLTHSLSSLDDHPIYKIAVSGSSGLCETCLKCEFSDVCGGGYLPNRYSTISLYNNPSVFCPDLKKLINHMINRCLSSPIDAGAL